MFMPKNRKFISCLYVNDMKCWNNLEKDEFQPKSNVDMMRCVTCNKYSLFAPKLNIGKQGNNKYHCGARKSVVELKDTNSFLFKIKIHSMYLNSIWLNLNSIPI